MSEQNLVPYYSRLSQKDKAILLYLLNGIPGRRVEHGTLPFVPVNEAINVLRAVAGVYTAESNLIKYVRPAKEILVKLAEAIPSDANPNFRSRRLMKLNPKKVYKHFGKRPDLGKPLPFLPKQQVTAGVRWNLPKQKWVPDDKTFVTPCVALREIEAGLYEVMVIERCRHAVEIWLMDNCR